MEWTTPVRFVPMVGPILAAKLEKLEIGTVEDLLLHLPVRYADFSLISPIVKLQEGEIVTVKGVVTESANEYRRGRFAIQKLIVKDSTGSVYASWFNQPYLVKTLIVGTEATLSGKVERFGRILQLASPEYEIVKEGKPLLHTGRLVPIYPETAGVSSKWLRNRIYYLLNSEFINEHLPPEVVTQYQLSPLLTALHTIHFPSQLSEVGTAHRRLAFDELFILALRSQIRREEWRTRETREPFLIDKAKVNKFISSFPFTLTGAQNKVIEELMADFASVRPMNRLLEGDVGSGKTVVAAVAIYVAHLNGYQSLCMAPTEILAEQHFKTLTSLLNPFGMKVGLQTGSKKSIETGFENKKTMSTRSFDILVGTHALIEKKVQLNNVGLVIIDEQHRFGVRQRALLREKGRTPHVLTMTATPIPRTMALTIYGDLDLSVIDEMPAHRKRIKTWVVPPTKRTAAYAWIKNQLAGKENHQQAFIICPFIEPSESLTTVKAVTQEFKKLEKEVFTTFPLGLLHGRMSSSHKEKVLSSFRRGKYKILVATPVVEVGIDVPTATIMLIEAAERFGLAQLHQLRGRVGRSDLQSYCLLFTSDGETQTSRLRSMEKAYTGAQLAELDLKIRGPGQVFGTLQHGKDLLKIANYSDPTLIESAKKAAETWFATHPTLNTTPALKERVLSGTIAEIAPD